MSHANIYLKIKIMYLILNCISFRSVIESRNVVETDRHHTDNTTSTSFLKLFCLYTASISRIWSNKIYVSFNKYSSWAHYLPGSVLGAGITKAISSFWNQTQFAVL